jgi:ribokinase
MRDLASKPDVVVVGSSNTDMVVASDRLPRPGETVLGYRFYQAPGGKGANQAVAAARAGARVAFVGAVGHDVLGEQARSNLAREGIDVRHLSMIEDAPSGVALILVDGRGENLISVAPGANGLLHEAMVEDARETLEAAKVLLLQLEVPLPTVVKAAELAAAGGIVILNPAPAPASALPQSLLAATTVFVANEEEMAAVGAFFSSRGEPDKTAAALLHRGMRHVVMTRGAKGGTVYSGEGQAWNYPAMKVKAVDSVGAGDCFCGWLAAAAAEGLPFDECVTRASLAAARSVTRYGAQPSLPRRDEVLP